MLTPKQQAFCRHYISELNATQAAIRAGYAEPTANREGSRLLSNVDIQEEIQRLRAELSESTGINLQDIVSEIRLLAKSAERDSDRLKAYDMLLKHLGGYVSASDLIDKLPPDRLEELCNQILSKLNR
jgi:phage terminase small subunit